MRVRKIVVAMVILVCACMVVPVKATTYYVDPNGNDDANGLSWSTAFAAIQKGIGSSSNGDIVEVNRGTYYESANVSNKNITLRSTDPNNWNIVEASVINGNGATNAVTFGSGSAGTLSGFTVTGSARGVYCTSGNLIVSNCIIKNNTYRGIMAYKGGIIANNCIIKDNTIQGIYAVYATVTVENSMIYGNDVGIRLLYASGTVQNNTIVNNARFGIICGTASSAAISNCILWNNSDDLNNCSATYSCIQDGDSGTGNISYDPCFIDAGNKDFHIDSNYSPCVNAGNPDGNYSGQMDIDGDTRLMWTAVDIGADETQAYILYGMEIISTVIGENNITVTTTGATYVLTASGIDLYRRIDPHDNNYDDSNYGKGRKVAELKFNPNIGALSVISSDKGKAEISSDKAEFTFYSDSFFVMEANDNIDCNYTNLVPAKWNGPLNPDYRRLDRIWIDDSGGSLHAALSGRPSLEVNGVNRTRFAMSKGNKMGFMAFPPKKFDFEGLYGKEAKPFMIFFNYPEELDAYCDPNNMDESIAQGFGIYVLNQYSYIPILLEDGTLGYKFPDANEAKIKDFIALAHQKGGKVLSYLFKPRDPVWDYNGSHQSYEVTLKWMQGFQRKYALDGWYLDEADAGTLWEDYDFVRKVRASIGENGIIYHHDSPDVWDQYFYGLRAINVDTYVNQTMVGEGIKNLSKLENPNDPYFRYYVSGYGTSQAYGTHNWGNYGKRKLLLEEIFRTLGQNLNGNAWVEWAGDFRPYYYKTTKNFRPFYKKRKAEYLNNAKVPFEPDVNWPVDWFKYAADVNVNINGSNALITWKTSKKADSKVFYTSTGYFWSPCRWDTPLNPAVGSSTKVTNHRVRLSGLEQNIYEFRIRSSNLEADDKEIIWSYAGKFVNPAHWWKLDETSGSVAVDFMGDASGTFSENNPFWVGGLIGGAIDLNGISDYFAIAGQSMSPANDYNSEDTFTVAGWFKTSKSTGMQTIVGQWGNYKPNQDTPTLYFGWQVLVENEKIVARFGTAGSDTSDIMGNKVVNDGNWHHFALVYPTSSSNATLYVDGNIDGTPAASSFSQGPIAGRIGDGSYAIRSNPVLKGGPFCGTIDDVMIFNRALSADEVGQLRESGL